MNPAPFRFLIPVVLLLLTILGVGFLSNLYLSQKLIPTPTLAPKIKNQALVPAKPQPTLPPVEKNKTFVSEAPAFKFKYPKDWEVVVCEQEVGLFRDGQGSCEQISEAQIFLRWAKGNLEASGIKSEEFSNSDYDFLAVVNDEGDLDVFDELLSGFQFLGGPTSAPEKL